ncbi:MAG: penicillin acylase family protein [Alphaproteobacteria bacterium]
MPRRIARALGGVALLFVGLLALGWVWLTGSLPQTGGRIAIPDLSAPVTIGRDRKGIAFIRAETDLDAYRALGFLHAQERLFQMELGRRVGQGRLSELFGAATLPTDRFMRTLDLYRLAQTSYEGLAAETRAAIDAYTGGVNAFLTTRRGALPPEFVFLGLTPEPWRPRDSLVWGRLMALRLSDNWHDELLRARLATRLPPERVTELFPDADGDGPATLAALASLYADLALDRIADAWPAELAPLDASNAWAVAGARTATGAPILANDPHLGLDTPSVWYLVRIDTPARSIVGVTAPGVPFHLLGHNGQIAWGFTTTHSDTQDFFIEKLDPEDPDRYLSPGGTLPFAVRTETIRVRGGDPVTLTVRASRHGPILSDIDADSRAAAPPGHVLALATPALATDDRTAEALHRLNRARDWPGFVAALRSFHSPQQNILYADRAGDIGFYAPGRVPIRAAGDGLSPAPGWTGTHDWTGYIPFADLPHGRNPASGLLVNANNRVANGAAGARLAAIWPAPYRAQRVIERLGTRAGLGADDMTAIQGDAVSLAARALLPLLLAPPTASPRAESARDLLRAWDGGMDRGAPEPLIYAAWTRALERLLFADELGEDYAGYRLVRPRVLIATLTRNTAWCDDTATAASENCAARVAAALEAALDRLTARHGEDIAAWRWGDDHIATFRHRVIARLPVIGGLIGARLATDGGESTVNRGTAVFDDSDRPFAHVMGATLRAVYDLNDLDRSRFMIVPGQSANPLSPHFADLVHPWRDLDFVTLPRSPAPGRITDTLTLVPGG